VISSSGATSTTTSGGACSPIPQETGGPFPGDGTNGPNVLEESGVVREDITSSIGSSTGVADGVPLTVKLTIVDSKACAPMAGAAVYLWQVDAVGRYSMYSQGASDQNYLRGVQAAADNGTLQFQSIFPSAYDGRWPHIHFEIFKDIAAATATGSKVRTTQLTLPEDACKIVYADTRYSASVANMARTTLAGDNVVRDGTSLQMATVTGDMTKGFVAKLNVAI